MRTSIAKQKRLHSHRGSDPESLHATRTPAPDHSSPISSLQRTAGNRAVGQFLQAKLAVSTPGDAYEQEADRVAEQLIPGPLNSSKDGMNQGTPKPVVQRRGSDWDSGGAEAPPGVHETISSAGNPLPSSLRHDMEQWFNHDFSGVQVHSGSSAEQSAEELHAKAYTVGQDVVLGAGQILSNSSESRRLMAHELAHVVQQSRAAPHGGSVIQRQPKPGSPHDKATVEMARRRLTLLEPRLAALEGRKLGIDTERLRVLADRKRLDENAADPFMKQKQQAEESNFASLNRAPVDVVVSGDAVLFKVKFHVRFEDASMKKRFNELKTNVQAGIDIVWKQRLEGVLAGRSFTIVPSFTLVDTTAPRDTNFWLITVRKVSTGAPVAYSGCKLPQPDPAVATSVTDSTCDGGVMSIPPSHIDKSGVLGHEIMHLFGLLDRYMMMTQVKRGEKPKVTTAPVRETGGRADPLGGEDGTILREDLGYLFDKFSVYEREEDRSTAGLGTLRREVMRLREIVRLGHDPNSLIPSVIRKDFRDKMIKDAENL